MAWFSLGGKLFLGGSSPAASGAALNRTQVGGRRRQISVEGAAAHNPPSPSSAGRGFSHCSSTSGSSMWCACTWVWTVRRRVHGAVLGEVRWHHWWWWDLWEESRVAPPRSPARSLAAAAIMHKEFSHLPCERPARLFHLSESSPVQPARDKGPSPESGCSAASLLQTPATWCTQGWIFFHKIYLFSNCLSSTGGNFQNCLSASLYQGKRSMLSRNGVQIFRSLFKVSGFLFTPGWWPSSWSEIGLCCSCTGVWSGKEQASPKLLVLEK